MSKIYKILNNKVEQATKVDYLILGVILFTYSILSFINLGSLKNPQTFYTFKEKEEITFTFSDLIDVIRIKLYNGESSGTYSLYVSSDNKDYTYIKDIEDTSSFAWQEEKILQRVKYVKLIAQNDNSNIGEVAFYDNSKKEIPIIETNSSLTNKNNSTKKLIDEKNFIPKEISYLNSTYFDEIYFARTAYDYVYNIETYEWTHPPLGKLIQAIPIKIFNTMAPFFYRLMGNIAGILMIAVMYFFGLALFKKRKYAIFSSLLMYYDCFHFAHTRMGTVDSFLILFILLSFYFMYQYLTKNNENKNLLLSGLFFGLATSVKWTGMLAGLGLAIIYFTDMIKNNKNKLRPIIKGFIFFVFIPLLIYISCYLIFPNNRTVYTTSIHDIVTQTEKMYNYHSKLDATHPFSSNWYTWPLSYKPVWYYSNKVTSYTHGTISGIGNIAIWWVGILALLYLCYRLFRKKDKNTYFILVAIFSMWLPYIFIGRVMFLYHFFPVLPFIMLGIVTLFHALEEKTKKNYFIPLYLLFVILIFILYYPVISGVVTNNNYLDRLKLLSSWYF